MEKVNIPILMVMSLKVILKMTKCMEKEKEICQEAFMAFHQDHFFDWAKMFSENLAEKIEGVYYPAAGSFLREFLKEEKSQFCNSKELQKSCI